MSRGDEYRVDKGQVRQSFGRAAASYDAAAVLQREVGERMLERLRLLRMKPERIADLGAGTGVATAELVRRYRGAGIVAVDIAEPMLQLARRRAPWLGRPGYVCGDVEGLPLRDGSVDMVFSNLCIQWSNDLDRTLGEFRRVLRPGGVVMFTTFGPDTLRELRASWAAVDAYSHTNAFMDMHDIGDALLRAGLAEPVMDVESFTLTYSELRDLMRDLKALGAHNATAGRARGLTGKGRLQALGAAYDRFRRDGRLPATYEVVYGHAWAPSDSIQTRNEHGRAAVPLEQLRRR
ncbi:MAG: malonyl-ACP O-methyltransferase BioC [Gammaproteobacteria bacterium]